MRGFIKERGNSYLIAVSMGKDPQTKKYKQYFETVKTTDKAIAQKRLRELLTELDKGVFSKPSKNTLAEYLETWLLDYCWPNLSPRSAEGYQYIVRKYIIPQLGQFKLKDLRPEHIQKLYTDLLKKGLSNRTVRYCHTTLHKALSSALKHGMMVRNPCDATDPPKVQRKEMFAMDEMGVQKFLEFAGNTPYFSMFYLFLTTGLRRSELLALRWSDLDFDSKKISVTRTMHQLRYDERKGNIIFKDTKSAKSRRPVILPPSTVQVMQVELQHQLDIKKALYPEVKTEDLIKSDDLIFSHLVDGSPILPDGVTHAFHRIALQSGLKNMRLHDCRHTHASILLKQNVHPAIVAARLGHSSVSVTMDVYSHILPGLQEKAAAQFDDFLTNKKALPSPKK